MGFFDEDDTFDSIVREFFGGSPVRKSRREQFIKGEDEDRIIDFIEDERKVYLVFELYGFNEKDVSVKITGMNLEISAKKSNKEDMQNYLNQKLRKGILIKKRLPNIVDIESMQHYFNNGVLEIILNKQGENKNGSRKIKVN